MTRFVATFLLTVLTLTIVQAQITTQSQAQPGWVTITNSDAGVSFQMPSGYQQKDTLSMSLYTKELSNVTMEAHYVNVTGAETLPGEVPSDPLQTFVDAAVLVNNAQLLGRQNVSLNGHAGVEVSLSYTDEEGQAARSYQCYFWFNQKVFAFSATARAEQADQLNTYKASFFGSVVFY